MTEGFERDSCRLCLIRRDRSNPGYINLANPFVSFPNRRSSAPTLEIPQTQRPPRFNRRNLPDGLDGYLIRRAAECATITYDQLTTGTMLGGANRVRRPPAAVAQPAPAG